MFAPLLFAYAISLAFSFHVDRLASQQERTQVDASEATKQSWEEVKTDLKAEFHDDGEETKEVEEGRPKGHRKEPYRASYLAFSGKLPASADEGTKESEEQGKAEEGTKESEEQGKAEEEDGDTVYVGAVLNNKDIHEGSCMNNKTKEKFKDQIANIEGFEDLTNEPVWKVIGNEVEKGHWENAIISPRSDTMKDLAAKTNDKIFVTNGMKTTVAKEKLTATTVKYGTFKFVDYGKKGMSPGVKEVVDRYTSASSLRKCNGGDKVIIMYGGSGAGKTFTTEQMMEGFQDKFKDTSAFSVEMAATEFLPYASDVEAFDLMKESQSQECKSPTCGKYDKDTKTHNPACKKVVSTHKNCMCQKKECPSRELNGAAIDKTYEEAMKYRVTKTTAFNKASSRGHVVIKVTVTSLKGDGQCSFIFGDLAGYENPSLAKLDGSIPASAQHTVEAEGKKIVEGIKKVGDALESIGEGKRPGPGTPLLDVLHLSGNFEAVTFIVCLNPCGMSPGRIQDTVTSLGSASKAIKGGGKLAKETPLCSTNDNFKCQNQGTRPNTARGESHKECKCSCPTEKGFTISGDLCERKEEQKKEADSSAVHKCKNKLKKKPCCEDGQLVKSKEIYAKLAHIKNMGVAYSEYNACKDHCPDNACKLVDSVE